MAEQDGRKPDGYDWKTVRREKPGWYRALRVIIAAAKWKERAELRRKRREEDASWKAGEILSWLHAHGF